MSTTESPGEETWLSTSAAADRLGVTSDAVVKMVRSGHLDSIRHGSGKGRYLVSRAQVEEERAVRLARLGAEDATGAEPELRRRIQGLEESTEAFRAEIVRLRGALQAEIVAGRAHLDAVSQFVVPATPND
jgi:excisionase family DNA binding protein